MKHFAALREYCYRVASAVGLVSIEIFGYKIRPAKNTRSSWGSPLQMTNILRDVARDLSNGRDLSPRRRHGAVRTIPKTDLAARTYDDRFVRLMQFEADRARNIFARGRCAPARAKIVRAMVGAEIMGSIYPALFSNRWNADRYRVFRSGLPC